MTDSPVPISRRNAVIGAVSAVSSHAINVGVLVWLQRHLLTEVPIEEFVLLPLVQAPLAVFPLISTTFAAGVGRFIVRAYARDEPSRVTTIVTSITPFLAIASGVILAIGAVASWKIDALVEFDSIDLVDDAQLMFFLLVCGAALRSVLSPLTLGMYARQRFVLMAILELSGQALRLALLLGLLFGVSQRVLWVVVASVTSDGVLLVVRLLISRSLAPEIRLRRGAFDRQAAHELIRFGSWSTLRRISTVAIQVVTPFLLKNLASSGALAVYYLVSLPGQVLQRFTIRAIRPLNPPIVAMHVQNQTDRIRGVYLNGGRYALWITTLVCVPVILLREPALSLYLAGTDLTVDGVELALLVCLSIPPIEFASVMLGPIANASGKERPIAIATAIYQGVSFVLVVTFVLLGWGAMGAVIGRWLGTMLLVPALIWTLGLRLTRTAWSEWLGRTLIPGFAPAVIGAAVWAPIGFFVRLESWVEVAIAFVAGAIPFAIVVYRRSMTAGERRDVQQLLDTFIRR